MYTHVDGVILKLQLGDYAGDKEPKEVSLTKTKFNSKTDSRGMG